MRGRGVKLPGGVFFCTDLLPASAVGVGDDVEQRVGQVAVAVEGVIPPTDGDVGEVPEGGDRRERG